MNAKTISDTNLQAINLARSGKNALIFFGFACFTSSLFIPVFFTSSENIVGYWVFITGWMGIVFAQTAWYANPMQLLSMLIASEKPKTAVLLSLLSLVLSTGALLIYEIPLGINNDKLFIKEYGFGMYLWILSHAFILLALIFNLYDSKKNKIRA